MKLSQRLAHVDAPAARAPRQRPLQARTAAPRARPPGQGGTVTTVAALKDRVRSGVIDGLGPDLVRSVVDEDRVRRAVDGLRPRLPAELDVAPGSGVLSLADAKAYGVSGPVGRAAGLDVDLRRDEPYLAYAQLPVRVVTRTAGDARARYECVLDQVHASLELADAVLDRLPGLSGPVNVRLPKTVKAPEGAVYEWTENPLGINGYYLVSRGERTPWRLKLRSASFNNVQALAALLPGTRVEDLTTVLSSLFFVVGDIDR